MPRGLNFISGPPITEGPFAARQRGQINRANIERAGLLNEALESEIAYEPQKRAMSEEAHRLDVAKAKQESRAAVQEQYIKAMEVATVFEADNLNQFDAESKIDPVKALADAQARDAAKHKEMQSVFTDVEIPYSPWNPDEARAALQSPDVPMNKQEQADYDHKRALTDSLNRDPADTYRPPRPIQMGDDIYERAEDGSYIRIGPAKTSKAAKPPASEVTRYRNNQKAIKAADVSLALIDETILMAEALGKDAGGPRFIARLAGEKAAAQMPGNVSEQKAHQLQENITKIKATEWKSIVGGGQISGSDYTFLDGVFSNPLSVWSNGEQTLRKIKSARDRVAALQENERVSAQVYEQTYGVSDGEDYAEGTVLMNDAGERVVLQDGNWVAMKSGEGMAQPGVGTVLK